MRILPRILVLASLLALCERPATAAPASLPDTPLDLELKAANVGDVLTLLAQIAKRKLAMESCVTGTLDLKLKNTPLPLVLDAVGTKLHLVYRDDGTTLNVGCAGTAPAADRRVSVAGTGATLDEVLAPLAMSVNVRLDYRASRRPAVTIALENVRPATAAAVLGESTGLQVFFTGDALVVTD